MPHPNIANWLTQWARTWSVPTLPSHARIEFSPRLRSALGRCHPRAGVIRLHPAVVNEPEEILREVLCHEAAHLAVYLLHGKSARPHGPEWAELMIAAGFEPRVRMDLAVLSRQFRQAVQPRLLYHHRCPICGASRIARRPVTRWRCRACRESGFDGTLEISTRPYAEVGGV